MRFMSNVVSSIDAMPVHFERIFDKTAKTVGSFMLGTSYFSIFNYHFYLEFICCTFLCCFTFFIVEEIKERKLAKREQNLPGYTRIKIVDMLMISTMFGIFGIINTILEVFFSDNGLRNFALVIIFLYHMVEMMSFESKYELYKLPELSTRFFNFFSLVFSVLLIKYLYLPLMHYT